MSHTAIVTGAASGIGAATADHLAGAGWTVVAADVAFDPTPDRESERAVTNVRCDISSADEVARLFQVASEVGEVRGVVNAAAANFPDDSSVEETPLDVFDRIVEVNLRGTLLMCRAAIGALRAHGGGSIVNFGSVASTRGVGGPGYGTSKAAIAGLSRIISTQHAHEHIRCNTLAPGATDTPMLAMVRRKATSATAPKGSIPGIARPEDVAVLVEFLLSDAAAFVSGALYTMDGGFTQH